MCVYIFSWKKNCLKETNIPKIVLEIYSLIFLIDSSCGFMCHLIGATLDFSRTNAQKKKKNSY